MKKVVITAVEKLSEESWLMFPTGDDGDVEIVNGDNVDEAAKALEISPIAVKMINDSLRLMADCIIEQVAEDLRDIYEKVDK